MEIELYNSDLPNNFADGISSIAVDTETMGLLPHRDRLCLVQLSKGDGVCHLVQINKSISYANLKSILLNPDILKIFHYARFDITTIYKHLGIMTRNVYCTKIASKLVRTYTNGHSLKDLCYDLLGIELSKSHGCTDWGNSVLTEEQKQYAAADVLYLHRLQSVLHGLLKREGRAELAQKCFSFLSARAKIDLMCGDGYDIFSHS
jgi:ribonuclease D